MCGPAPSHGIYRTQPYRDKSGMGRPQLWSQCGHFFPPLLLGIGGVFIGVYPATFRFLAYNKSLQQGLFAI